MCITHNNYQNSPSSTFNFVFSEQELILNDVNNDNNADSSDSEGEKDELYSSDDDEELSFESDDEGNFKPNLNKQHQIAQAESNEDDSNSELDDEEESNDENELSSEDEVENDEENDIDSDASEELSYEENSDSNDSEKDSEIDTKNVNVNKSNGNNKSLKGAKASTLKDAQIASKSVIAGETLQKKKTEPNAVEAFKNELNKTVSNQEKTEKQVDEYEQFDTDDEEDIRNTVGNIPMHWYDEYKHIGYDWDAKQIIKPAKRDQLDDFLKRMEDPNFWRTVKDPQTGQEVILSEADIDLIKRINSRKIPDANFDDYAVRLITCFFFH